MQRRDLGARTRAMAQPVGGVTGWPRSGWVGGAGGGRGRRGPRRVAHRFVRQKKVQQFPCRVALTQAGRPTPCHAIRNSQARKDGSCFSTLSCVAVPSVGPEANGGRSLPPKWRVGRV